MIEQLLWIQGLGWLIYYRHPDTGELRSMESRTSHGYALGVLAHTLTLLRKAGEIC